GILYFPLGFPTAAKGARNVQRRGRVRRMEGGEVPPRVRTQGSPLPLWVRWGRRGSPGGPFFLRLIEEAGGVLHAVAFLVDARRPGAEDRRIRPYDVSDVPGVAGGAELRGGIEAEGLEIDLEALEEEADGGLHRRHAHAGGRIGHGADPILAAARRTAAGRS